MMVQMSNVSIYMYTFHVLVFLLYPTINQLLCCHTCKAAVVGISDSALLPCRHIKTQVSHENSTLSTH